MSQIPTYAQIVESAAPALLRLAVMLTGSREDAEDLLQATVLRTHRHADRLEGMTAPVAYLRRVMVNEHISSARRRARRVRMMPFPPQFEPRWAGNDIARADERDRVWRLLPLLSPAQRSVLVLRYYEDLPDAEIAAILGLPDSTVRSHAARGLAMLRAHLADNPEVTP